MDEQGVDYAIMLPTLASLVEERMRDDPDLCAAAIHALNQWMPEAWPYAFEGRIFSDPDHHPGGASTRPSRSSTGWSSTAPGSSSCAPLRPGATRAAVVRPAGVRPVLGAGCEEAGVLVVFHASDTGYVRYTNEWEGPRPRPRPSPSPSRSARRPSATPTATSKMPSPP